jgi:glycosyltransferase involved in cell wall biosynthesis|tara:strand:- start:20894 stop:21667 length:774 start_codon:yes stop_codon:yes gene_type:complete
VKDKVLIIVTYNREPLLKRVLESIDPTQFDDIIIVRDGGGQPYDPAVEKVVSENFSYLPQTENIGVGRCKQIGIDHALTTTTSDHIFIIEDDILIKDNKVWDYYVDFSSRSGVHHTNWNDYRYHGSRFEVDYDGIKGIVTKDVEGAFSYFHRNVFKFCEFPVTMKNAFEHISVEVQLIEKDLLPPFWYFICPKDSGDFLEHIGEESTITGKPNYTENYQEAHTAFVSKHGFNIGQIPDVGDDVVLERLKFLKETYAK